MSWWVIIWAAQARELWGIFGAMTQTMSWVLSLLGPADVLVSRLKNIKHSVWGKDTQAIKVKAENLLAPHSQSSPILLFRDDHR